METKEKHAPSPSQKNHPTRFSRSIHQHTPSSEPPKRFPVAPLPVLHRQDISSTKDSTRQIGAGLLSGGEHQNGIKPEDLSHNQPVTDYSMVHPLFRPGVGSSNNSSDSVPLDQIGLAISAEEPGRSAIFGRPQQDFRKGHTKQRRSTMPQRNSALSQRPDSCVTEGTVFEEDDFRRESRLLPMPAFPIPPIRSFQPSRPPPKVDRSSKMGIPTRARQLVQQPELFLNIPVRHSRSQPMPIVQRAASSAGAVVDPVPSQRNAQLAPPIHISSDYSQTSTLANSPEPSNGGDIPDYYFTAYQDSSSRYLTPQISPSRLHRPKDSPKMINIKPKPSSSNVSQATSKASTNIRDSFSSQTSFESIDPDDPTPEYEDEDKRLSGDKLSPVAESPISNLRYPKVPRASNQLVPRSPKSPQSQRSQRSQDSPRRAPEPSSLLAKRRGDQGGLHLDSPFGSPNRVEVKNHMRQYRQHLRSNSMETWSPVRTSERSTRTQSGQWPKSPAMYEPDVVQPLRVHSRLQQQPRSVEMEALKSPAWVPRLTPRRQGEDLLLDVSYSKPSH